ncbi:LpqN/LpqT family lipoprotein [Mycobacterium sp. MMS18-G62]
MKAGAVAKLGMLIAGASLALTACGGHGATGRPGPTVPGGVGYSTISQLSASPPRVADYPPGLSPTVWSYLYQDGIATTIVARLDKTGPQLRLPFPKGWVDAGKATRDNAYGGIEYIGTEANQYRPTITAYYVSISGNVVAQKIVDLLPGELVNLPGFTETASHATSRIDEFPSYQLEGTWSDEGQRKFVATRTVLMPAADGLYLLHFAGDSLASQAPIFRSALDVIADRTVITG